MTRALFIKHLSDGLKKIGVTDTEEIIKDYESHFDNEILKGKTEEEIAKTLGKIDDILFDFQPENQPRKQRKIMSIYSVIMSDLFIYIGMLSLYLLGIAIVMLSISSLILGLYFVSMMNILDFIPTMIFPFSQFLGATFIALSFFAFGLSVIFFKFLNASMKKLVLWHKQVLKGQLHQFVYIKHSDIIRIISLWSGIAVAALLIATYLVGVIQTGNLQFWDSWHWFN